MNARLAQAFPVGELLADELAHRGWTQTEFAEILGRPAQVVSEIVSGKKEITRESAAQIGAAFGSSPQMWLRMQDTYLLWKEEQNERTRSELSQVARRANLNSKGPIGLLQRLGYLQAEGLEEQEAEVLEFFELDSLEDVPKIRLAARKSSQTEQLTALQTAWAYAVRATARQAPPSATYSAEKLAEVAASLPRLLTTPQASEGLRGGQ